MQTFKKELLTVFPKSSFLNVRLGSEYILQEIVDLKFSKITKKITAKLLTAFYLLIGLVISIFFWFGDRLKLGVRSYSKKRVIRKPRSRSGKPRTKQFVYHYTKLLSVNPQFPADSVKFIEKIVNGKLHFLCSISIFSLFLTLFIILVTMKNNSWTNNMNA